MVKIWLRLTYLGGGQCLGPLGPRHGGIFLFAPLYASLIPAIHWKKVMWKSREITQICGKTHLLFFPMLFSMKFDKLSVFNRYFAGRLVSIFQVLIVFNFDKLPAYCKKLFLAGKQVSISRNFPFLLFLFFFFVNSEIFGNIPAYYNQRASICWCVILRDILAISLKIVKLPAYYKTLMPVGMQASSLRDFLLSFLFFSFLFFSLFFFNFCQLPSNFPPSATRFPGMRFPNSQLFPGLPLRIIPM